jgi:hypothetical protein
MIIQAPNSRVIRFPEADDQVGVICGLENTL